MKTYLEYLAPTLIACIFAFGSYTGVQDEEADPIVIVDQDGQKVAVKGWKVQAQNTDKVDVDIQVGDGKIVIVDKDGQRREIDVSGAQNIIVNKSVQSIIQDGEEKKQVMGKAIIIGPDGERQEIDLGDGIEGFGDLGANFNGVNEIFKFIPDLNAEGEMRLPGNFMFGPSVGIGKYMIGVSCSPVSDQLRAHLDLTEGVGLVVSNEPGQETAAATAGIQQHDILMFADQEALSTIADLIAAVQLAGKEDRILSLTLLRGGKELGVDVKPQERKDMKGHFKAFFPGSGDVDLRFEKVGPGFIVDAEERLPAELLERMEAIDQQIQQRMEEMTQLQEKLRQSLPDFQRKDDN